jgi:hypothetical protein
MKSFFNYLPITYILYREGQVPVQACLAAQSDREGMVQVLPSMYYV